MPNVGASYEIWTPFGKKSGYAYTKEDAKFIVLAVNAYEENSEIIELQAAQLREFLKENLRLKNIIQAQGE